MPVHPVKGQPGCYQWGESGKVYCGDGAKEKAEAQGRAAYASGYKSKAEMQMQMPMESKYQEGDDRWWLFHKWEVRDDKTLMTYQDNGRFKIWVLINPYHFNGRMEQNGKLTFICTTKHADAKEECLNWISANLPELKGKSPFYARKDREQFSRDKRYYSVEFDGLTYREEGFGRKRLDGYAGFRADEDKKNFTTIEDVKIGDVFKFGDGWERFVLKSKEIDGYEWDSKADEEVVVYKIVFDPYKPSPVSDIVGLVRSNAKIVRWDNVYLQMARRRLELGAEESEQMDLESFREGLYHLYLKGKITEAECAAWSDDYEAFFQGEGVKKPPFAAETFEAESKPYSVEISRSSNSEKKLMAVFSDKEGNKIKTTHFGQRGASDYTKHGDRERMKRYLERHGGGTTTSTKENWKDPTTAGSLSRWILWNKPSLSGSFSDYKRRFGLKGTMKVSKSAEGKLSSAQKSLNKWTKEDWGTKSGKPSTQGEEATGERYLPRKAREALTDKEYARTSAKKRRDTAKGKQFSPQPDDVEEKTAKYRSEVFEAIEGKGSKARFTDQPDPKIYRDTGLRQKARNSLLKGTKGGDAGEWSARKAQMAATRYRTLYEDKYGEGKNPYF
jgi:hypothetical protein